MTFGEGSLAMSVQISESYLPPGQEPRLRATCHHPARRTCVLPASRSFFPKFILHGAGRMKTFLSRIFPSTGTLRAEPRASLCCHRPQRGQHFTILCVLPKPPIEAITPQVTVLEDRHLRVRKDQIGRHLDPDRPRARHLLLMPPTEVCQRGSPSWADRHRAHAAGSA